jgi:hypothetical protein
LGYVNNLRVDFSCGGGDFSRVSGKVFSIYFLRDASGVAGERVYNLEVVLNMDLLNLDCFRFLLIPHFLSRNPIDSFLFL